MNSIKNNEIYKSLNQEAKDAVSFIKEIATNVAESNKIEIIEESFDKNSDTEDWWYSYVITVNSEGVETQALNEAYIDKMIENDNLLDAENKIIFRFESGGRHAA